MVTQRDATIRRHPGDDCVSRDTRARDRRADGDATGVRVDDVRADAVTVNRQGLRTRGTGVGIAQDNRPRGAIDRGHRGSGRDTRTEDRRTRDHARSIVRLREAGRIIGQRRGIRQR